MPDQYMEQHREAEIVFRAAEGVSEYLEGRFALGVVREPYGRHRAPAHFFDSFI